MAKNMKLLRITGFFALSLFLSLIQGGFVYGADKDTPDEESMFGSDQPGGNEADRDAFKEGEAVDNPLQIGGSLYYRFIASPQVGKAAGETPISLPLLVDGFFDGRPNDRIRVYIDARLIYDATRDKYSQTTSGTSLGSTQASSTATVTTSTTTNTIPNNPQVVLDQAWLKFDFGRKVFVTAGNQHVKWGTARFWNPTDFINTQKRDPLLQQDLRLGLPMLRFDVPLQSISSNFTIMGFFDQPEPASTLGQLGAGARYELVIKETEIGFDVVYRNHGIYNDNLVYGIDFSAPLGPFDVYGEGALIRRAPAPHYTLKGTPTTGSNLGQFLTVEDSKTPLYEAAGGLSYTFGWLDNRLATIGAEYFYNETGYDNSAVYPVLILSGQYQPFYLGKHYAAVYLSAEGPDSGKRTNYTLSVLSNLSDKSLIGRLDFTWRFLTYMTLEIFASGHFGKAGGEFNFSLDTPLLLYNGNFVPPINVPATLFDAGFALRTSF